MRIIPIEVEVEPGAKWPTLSISILHFDWPDGDTSLFHCGWTLGKFYFDILFWWAISGWVQNRLDR